MKADHFRRSLIFCRWLNVVDGDHIHKGLGRFQLQAELLLDSMEDIGCGSSIFPERVECEG